MADAGSNAYQGVVNTVLTDSMRLVRCPNTTDWPYKIRLTNNNYHKTSKWLKKKLGPAWYDDRRGIWFARLAEFNMDKIQTVEYWFKHQEHQVEFYMLWG